MHGDRSEAMNIAFAYERGGAAAKEGTILAKWLFVHHTAYDTVTEVVREGVLGKVKTDEAGRFKFTVRQAEQLKNELDGRGKKDSILILDQVWYICQLHLLVRATSGRPHDFSQSF